MKSISRQLFVIALACLLPFYAQARVAMPCAFDDITLAAHAAHATDSADVSAAHEHCNQEKPTPHGSDCKAMDGCACHVLSSLARAIDFIYPIAKPAGVFVEPAARFTQNTPPALWRPPRFA